MLGSEHWLRLDYGESNQATPVSSPSLHIPQSTAQALFLILSQVPKNFSLIMTFALVACVFFPQGRLIILKINPRISTSMSEILTFIMFLSNLLFGGVPGWPSRLSIQLLISAQVMIPGSRDRAPCWALHRARSLLEILFFSPSAPLPLLHVLSLSLSLSLSKIKINK